MTPKQARKRRAELESALLRAQHSYTLAAMSRAPAEAAREQAVRALGALRTAHASGAADAEQIQAAEQHAIDAEQAVMRATDQANAGLDAVKAIEQQLADLLSEHLAVFAEDAEDATQQAAAALLALEEPYRRAQGAWEASAQAWAPVARAAHVGGVGAFPVPDLFEAVRSGAVVARPVSVRVTKQA